MIRESINEVLIRHQAAMVSPSLLLLLVLPVPHDDDQRQRTWEEGGGADDDDDDTAQVSLTVCELVPSDDYYYPLRSIAKLVLFPTTSASYIKGMRRCVTKTLYECGSV